LPPLANEVMLAVELVVKLMLEFVDKLMTEFVVVESAAKLVLVGEEPGDDSCFLQRPSLARRYLQRIIT